MRRFSRAVIACVAVIALCAGCSLNATDLPIPGTALSGAAYRVNIELKTALNLPDKAKVFLQGVEVGKVDRVTIEGSNALVAVDIREGVTLSTETKAQVKQSSLMGDLFVELSPPKNARTGGVLRDGDRIPIRNTAPPDNIEDMLRSLAVFVVGAPSQDLADLVNQVNGAMPSAAEVRSLSASAKKNLHDLASSNREISSILDSADSVAAVLSRNSNRVDLLLDAGPARISGLKDVLYGVIDLMMSLAHFTAPLTPVIAPITPDLKRIISTVAPTLLTVANSDRTIVADVRAANALVRDKLIPFLQSPLNIAIRGGEPAAGTPGQRADDLIRMLRGMGMLR